ncbi:MAG: BtaA family protein [Thermoguttaceae bacterium]|nr:BtaA family protein [Thermoguttaceae bacterium]
MSCCLCKCLSTKLFNLVHRNNLVYNTCWEDPRIDKQALRLGSDDDVLVITSAGCNALSYALDAPRSVHSVDVNYRQNALLELKIAGIKELEFETFFQLFGQGRYKGVTELYRTRLRDRLTPPAQKFWDRKIASYFDGKYPFFFRGTSGFFARKMNAYLDRRGVRGDIVRLLNAGSVDDQRQIWPEIKKRLFSPMVRFMIDRDAVLALLGVPRVQRLQIERTYGGHVSQFAEEALDEVFGRLSVRDNYFWRLYATGSYTKECCPEYLQEHNFYALKEGLIEKVHVHTDTVDRFLRRFDGTISRFVLLDHMDWLCDRLYDVLVAEWNAIFAKAAPSARAIWRSGGLATDYLDSIPITRGGKTERLGDLLRLNRDRAAELHKEDRVHTYGSFYIADLITG